MMSDYYGLGWRRGFLAGHGLRSEGKTFVHGRRVQEGPASCSCGELSPAYGSDAERKRWHKRHKSAVVHGLEEDATEEP